MSGTPSIPTGDRGLICSTGNRGDAAASRGITAASTRHLRNPSGALTGCTRPRM